MVRQYERLCRAVKRKKKEAQRVSAIRKVQLLQEAVKADEGAHQIIRSLDAAGWELRESPRGVSWRRKA